MLNKNFILIRIYILFAGLNGKLNNFLVAVVFKKKTVIHSIDVTTTKSHLYTSGSCGKTQFESGKNSASFITPSVTQHKYYKTLLN